MDNNRFELIGVFESDVWMLKSPVEVQKIALIYDTLKGMHCAQLSLVNTSPRRIVSVHVEVETYDSGGNLLSGEPVVHIYQTLAEKNAPFGMDETFYLNTDKAAKVKCYLSKIVFLDGAVWRPSDVIHVTAEPLDGLDPELFAIYKDELSASLYAKVDTEYKYFPRQADDYWVCTCGRANENADNHCARCGMNRTFLLGTLNIGHLEGIKREREEQLIRAECEREEMAERMEAQNAETETAGHSEQDEQTENSAEPTTVRITHAEAEELEDMLKPDTAKPFLRNKFVVALLAVALLGSLGYIIYLFIQSV